MKKKKYFLSSIFLSTLAVSASIIAACSTPSQEGSSSTSTPPENQQIISLAEINQVARKTQPNYQDEVRKNGLLVDAQEKAGMDDVLMYSINWAAVLHKYGAFSHFLKVLEINPNKEIYIYVQSDTSNKQSPYSIFSYVANLKDKFPNVKLRIIDKWNSWETFMFHHAIIEEDLKNLKDKKVDIYLDDYAILKTLESYYSLVSSNKSVDSANALILDNYSFLSEMNSINLIADGTASFRFYDDNFVKGMALTGNAFDNQTNSYKLSDEIRKDLYLKNISKNKLLNMSNYSGALLLQSFITSFKPLNDSNTIPTKYFNPGTTTIVDMNSNASLALSSLKNTGLFFDPYFSVSANIIGFFKSFNSESLKLFQAALSIVDVEDKTALMSNRISLVYSGRLMDTDEILTGEAKRIISMYKNENSVERETIDNPNPLSIQVLFKAHPRQADDYQTKLINKINELYGKVEASTWLKFLNKSNPFEFYVFEGFISSDPSDNQIIKYYAGYSTTVYFIDSNNQLDDIQKIIVSDSDLDRIKYYNGYPSSIFSLDRVILDKDFI